MFHPPLTVAEAEALAVGLADVHAVGQLIQDRHGHSLGAADLGSPLEGQVRSHDQALSLAAWSIRLL